VDQEAADELVGVERHKLVAGVRLGPVILNGRGRRLGKPPFISGTSANYGSWGNKIWVGCGLHISDYNRIYEVILDHIHVYMIPFRW
jgi:hypothetical protein